MDFIGEYGVSEKVCDGLINFFNTSDYAAKNKYRGFVGEDTNNVQPLLRSSTDVNLTPDLYQEYPEIQNYMKQLGDCIDQYKLDYPACNDHLDPWNILEGPKIQYYKPGEAYFAAHSERDSADYPYVYRHLVYMTYLNTVTDKGGTEFIHQKKITNAVKGKTIIWPADWTYQHRGVMSPTQEKYIITGWLSFIPKHE